MLHHNMQLIKNNGEDGFAFLRKSHGGCECPQDRTLAKSRLSNPFSKYPYAEKDQSERIGLFLASLAEMNLRRNIEGYFKTESSEYKLNKWVPGTFGAKNKG